MSRSILPYSTLLACIVFALSLTVPFISLGDETDTQDATRTTDSAVSDTSKELEAMFERVGVNPESNTNADADSSWVDRVTGVFQANDEPDELPIDGSESTPGDAHAESLTDVDPAVETEPRINEPIQASTDLDSVESSKSVPVIQSSDLIPETAPTSLPVPAAVTLDELIESARNTDRMKQEDLQASLDARRRLALAMRATLEAASQVAEYGQAGSQLLRDASLDTIVATMIADNERAKEDAEEPASATGHSSPGSPSIVSGSEPNSDVVTGFEAWQPVYVVEDAGGYRVGWRNTSSGERTSAYVGESLTFGEDIVTIVHVSSDHLGRSLAIDINGERHIVSPF